MLDWAKIISLLIVPAFWILGRTLIVIVVRDFARRFTLTLFGIWLFDRTLGRLLTDHVWSGRWRVTWSVASPDFPAKNQFEGKIYRCFDTIVAEGRGHVVDGESIPYAFVGKLSRADSILTGTWFDRRGTKSGYHGAFQIRLPAAKTIATGTWVGFSDSKPTVRVDELVWERIGD